MHVELITSDRPTTTIEAIQAVLADIVACGRTFELPGDENTLHVVPISSGVDSTATALVLKALYPNTRFIYCMTDTGIEVEGTRQALERIAAVTGQVMRIDPGKSLFDMVEAQGDYLPSQRQRWCTRMAKMMPYDAFIKGLFKQFPNATIASYVGIRADESGREGGIFTDTRVRSYFPLQALGLAKRDVMQLVDRTVGIPEYYLAKSRSGCSVCIFSRRSEIVDRWQREPEALMRAAKQEGVEPAREAVLIDMPVSVANAIGVGRNHLRYAFPHTAHSGSTVRPLNPWELKRHSIKASYTADLFGLDQSRRVYVAVEWTMLTDSEPCFARLVNYSSSLGGLKRSLKHYWSHRLDTREILADRDETKMRDDYRIAIYEINVADWEAQMGTGEHSGYSWQNDGKPLLEIRKVMAIVDHILLREGLEQEQRFGGRAEVAEWLQRADLPDLGQIIWAEWYDKPLEADLKEDIDLEDAPVMCNACSR